MANTIITPAIIAREVLATLYEQTVMASLVYRDFEPDFQGTQGDTISVRRPATFTVNEFNRASGISVQTFTESSFTVALDKLPDVSFAVTAEELTLNVDRFSERFLVPAAEAIAQWVDVNLCKTAVLSTAQSTGVSGTDVKDPRILVDCAKMLNDKNVPKSNRYAMLTTKMAAYFKKDDLFVRADERGSTDGLIEASLGRKFGADLYESTNLPAVDAASAAIGRGFVAHQTALSLVTRTLAAPMGVAPNQVSVMDYKGLGLRVIQAYDNTYKQDVISIDMLAGFKLLDANRLVRIIDKP